MVWDEAEIQGELPHLSAWLGHHTEIWMPYYHKCLSQSFFSKYDTAQIINLPELMTKNVFNVASHWI